jgi:hypothetical protein
LLLIIGICDMGSNCLLAVLIPDEIADRNAFQGFDAVVIVEADPTHIRAGAIDPMDKDERPFS